MLPLTQLVLPLVLRVVWILILRMLLRLDVLLLWLSRLRPMGFRLRLHVRPLEGHGMHGLVLHRRLRVQWRDG